MSIPAEKIEQFNTLVQQFPQVERKGKTTPYTSLNGHMFSFLTKEGKLGLRLSPDDREAFLTHYNVSLMEQHGRIMKEFVTVPESLLADTATLSDYFQLSYDYTASLKPKPTKKTKPKKA